MGAMMISVVLAAALATSDTPILFGKNLESQGCPEGQVHASAGCAEPPKLLSKVEPRYPKSARKEHLEGVVIYQAIVMSSGRLEQFTLLSSKVRGRGFEEAALDALKQWRYSPATFEGKPVPCYWVVKLEFRLR
jgi:protein TonB